MSGYSNYDRRGLRLNLSTKTKKIGIETVINNLGAPTVFGGRLFVRPLQKEEGGIPLLNSLEFGGTYLMDIEPNQIPDNTELLETIDEDPLIALGADVGFPLEAGSEDPDFVQDLFRLDSKSAFAVRIGYEIFPRFEVAMLREYRFQQIADAAGETRFEPIHKTSVEAGFRLNF